MTPRDLDAAVVERRLVLLDRLVRDLAPVVDDPSRMRMDRLVRYGIERVLTQLVELASDINAHVAATTLGQAPGSYRESFELAGEAGLVPPELVAALLPSVGLRNVLVHEYVAIDDAVVDAAVPLAHEAYGRYAAAARAWLTARA